MGANLLINVAVARHADEHSNYALAEPCSDAVDSCREQQARDNSALAVSTVPARCLAGVSLIRVWTLTKPKMVLRTT